MTAYKNSCVCGERFINNCAHFFSNWLIENGVMAVKLSGCYCCSSGRPIRAKEIRDNYFKTNFSRTLTDPGRNCFIYCEKESNGQGHVYFGTKTYCAAGTGIYSEATHYEYYI